MEPQKLHLWMLLGDAWRQFTTHWKLAALTVLGLVVAAFIHFMLGFAVIAFAQFELTYSILAERDLLAGGYGKRRFLAAMAVQMVMGIIFTIGWMVLILPGIYLMLRLYFSVPALIAEEAGVFEALAISWRRTAGQELALLGATAMAAVPAILPWVAMFAAVEADSDSPWGVVVSLVCVLLAAALFPIFCACIAATGYAGVGADTRTLEEVFS